jgi:hypothetical protein
MESGGTLDFFWFCCFVLMLLSLNLINHFIVKSIRDKPLGKQSVFDLASKDTFLALKFNGSVGCLVCIFARFDCLRQIFLETPILVTILCSIYSFAFICLCISAGCLCIIRILCIVKMTIVEDVLGEFKIRFISSFVTLISGVSFTGLFVIFGDVNTGSPMALLTMHVVQPGKSDELLYLDLDFAQFLYINVLVMVIFSIANFISL